jgi:hypothetical protein
MLRISSYRDGNLAYQSGPIQEVADDDSLWLGSGRTSSSSSLTTNTEFHYDIWISGKEADE